MKMCPHFVDFGCPDIVKSIRYSKNPGMDKYQMQMIFIEQRCRYTSMQI